MEGEVKHIYVNYDQNEKSNDETNFKDTGVSEVAQIESRTHQRPQRRRQAPRRLEECEISPDSVVNSEGYLIHFSFLNDENPISHLEVMERKVWKKATREELRSIEKNKT